MLTTTEQPDSRVARPQRAALQLPASLPALRDAAAAPGPLPHQVEMILSAIEAGQFTPRERRCTPRSPFRQVAKLRLFSDAPNVPAWTLYTRDANARGVGFITPHRLPLGYGGLLDLVGPDGAPLTLHCTLLRCREAAPGWFEGSLHFNRQQPEFEG